MKKRNMKMSMNLSHEEIFEELEHEIKSDMQTMNYGMHHNITKIVESSRYRIEKVLMIVETFYYRMDGFSPYALESLIEGKIKKMKEGEAIEWINDLKLDALIEMFNELSE